ncbi:MAG TPA: adenylyl-sulfate kinase, partial [Armatimonadaceae bacterium]|nr:adenylyl-sulfate kinase [Armatimonadaceae bacterium]
SELIGASVPLDPISSDSRSLRDRESELTRCNGTLPPAAEAATPEGAGGAIPLRVVVVGHVDHGKSTLLGRIFFDTDALPEGKAESIRKASEAEGMPFEYAFLLDALLEEQSQNITIDTTQIPFRTERRRYTLIDAPGHTEFLKNMVTGAASADAAVLVIAASEGVREQSRRHGYLLKLLGIPQVVVAINKMDVVNYDSSVYDQVRDECAAFLKEIGLEARAYIPISAREGDNVARRATAVMPWYDGPATLEALDRLEAPRPEDDLPLRFLVQDVYRFDARRIIAGRVETGVLRVGDTLAFAPGNRSSRVAGIERWNGPTRDYAVAGESIGVTLAEQIFVERGAVASLGEDAPSTTTRLRASVFWMGPDALHQGETLKLRLATQQTEARVVRIERVIDASTLEAKDDVDRVGKNDVAELVMETSRPVAWDHAEHFPSIGRFVLVRGRRVAGGGIVTGSEAVEDQAGPVSRNIVWSDAPITVEERTRRNGHGGAVVWLTGLSGAGKSTLANAVCRDLFDRGIQTAVLDGDNLRHGLCADLGFAAADRTENIRRAAHVAALLAQTGQVVLTAFISPYRADRAAARDVAARAGVPFVEVFVDAPLEVCESRDSKGLYAKARAGEIRGFTGIDAPYETPAAPDVTLPTGDLSREDAASALREAVLARV